MKLKYPYEVKVSPDFGIIPTIKLLLEVESPKGPAPFIFLFDTGADVSSLPSAAAKKLGVDLDKCPQETMSGYEGNSVTVYMSPIKIKFGDKFFPIPCVFHPSDDVPILLGRAGILDKFNIFLDGKKKEITFEQL